MNFAPWSRFVTLTAFLTLGLAAQGTPLPDVATPALPLDLDPRVPVHRAPALAGEPGQWWAGGQDFKASFHDGFAFFPQPPAGIDHHVPIRWHTHTRFRWIPHASPT